MAVIDTSEAKQEEQLDFKGILPVLVITLIDLMGLTLIIPLLPLYAAAFGASAFAIGLLSATYPILQFIGAPLLGGLSDRYGRRPVLLVSQVGTFLGFVLLGLSGTLWMLFLSRAIDGLSGANIATAQAVIADKTTEKTRTQGLGLIGAAFGIGFIVGPIIAFATLSFSGNNYPLVAFVAAGFSLASIVLTYVWLEESRPARVAERGRVTSSYLGLRAMIGAVRRPGIGLLLGLMFAQQFAFGGFEHLLSLFTVSRLGMNASSNAALFVYAGIIVVAVQGGFVGRWSRRWGDRRLVLIGLLALGLGLILSSLTPHTPVPWYSRENLEEELSAPVGRAVPEGEVGQVPAAEVRIGLPEEGSNGWLGLAWLMVAIIPIAIGGGVLQPSINSLITRRVAAEEVGGNLGISAAFLSAANATAPVVLGGVFELLGSTAPFLTGGLLALVLWGISRRKVPSGAS